MKVGDINVQSKLTVFQLKHVIAVVIIKDVQARANIDTVIMFCHKLKLDPICGFFIWRQFPE